MSFAYGTQMQAPAGAKAIEDYRVGDAVLAGFAEGEGWRWAQGAVRFGDGVPPGGSEATMVYVTFGDGGRLIVGPDKLLLIAGNRLRRADRLSLREDRLVAADGRALAIDATAMGRFKGGVHDLATSVDGSDWDGGLDGHLLNAGGVICADFFLQVHQRDARMARFLAKEAR